VSQYQKVKPIWILLKQEAVSGSGISWAVCKSAPCSPPLSFFTGWMPFLPPPNQWHKSTEGRDKNDIHILKVSLIPKLPFVEEEM